MGITEKLHHSSDSTRITLFKEGLFYKCYNQDAMLFTKLVKPYRVSVKYIKSVGAEILSIGFPASEVSKGNLTYEGLTETLRAERYEIVEENVTFHLKENIKQGFETWRNSIVSEKSEEYTPKPKNNKSLSGAANYPEIMVMIKQFDLANSTPG